MPFSIAFVQLLHYRDAPLYELLIGNGFPHGFTKINIEQDHNTGIGGMIHVKCHKLTGTGRGFQLMRFRISVPVFADTGYQKGSSKSICAQLPLPSSCEKEGNLFQRQQLGIDQELSINAKVPGCFLRAESIPAGHGGWISL